MIIILILLNNCSDKKDKSTFKQQLEPKCQTIHFYDIEKLKMTLETKDTCYMLFCIQYLLETKEDCQYASNLEELAQGTNFLFRSILCDEDWSSFQNQEERDRFRRKVNKLHYLYMNSCFFMNSEYTVRVNDFNSFLDSIILENKEGEFLLKGRVQDICNFIKKESTYK